MTRSRGVTLVEILIAVAIFSIIVGSIMQLGDFVGRRIFRIRDATDRMDQMVRFLSVLSADVREARQVLHTAPSEIGIWRADENGDSQPETAETVGYAWDGAVPGEVIRQAGTERSTILTNVRDFKLKFDRESPLTRHVMVELLVGNRPDNAQVYHYSLNLRTSEVMR